jgi:hypothetical protein
MELSPFTPYLSKPTPESRLALTRQIMNPADDLTDQIVQGLMQIIAMEGPTLSTRAFTLYAKNGGLAKLSTAAIRRFTLALKKAIKSGKILMELDTNVEKTQALLWLPSMNRVIPREYGNRGFDNIPTSELGEVMFEMASDVGEEKGKLYEEIIKLYGLKQLPKNATARLDLVYKEYLS